LKVTRGLEKARHVPGTITTLGSFDGVHLGHQQLLQIMRDRKAERGLSRTLVMTFHPHPQIVLKRPGPPVELLTTIEERLDLLAAQGIDETLVIEFTPEFAQTRYADFFERTIVGALGTTFTVIGFNHAFGKNREGDAEHLRSIAPGFGVDVEEVPPFVLNGVSISSTKIRNALHAMDAKNANAWLGRRYSFSGTVIEGAKLGRTLGYPTANLRIAEWKLVPADGVYSCTVHHGDRTYTGALSIGSKPAIEGEHSRTIEVFLLDFDGDLYGATIEVSLGHFIREQSAFASLDELTARIGRDVEIVRRLEL
jgi:riboflavin kinase/FMN adenylyltransferase